MDDDVLATLGSPLVRVDSPPETTVAAKVESRNPGGSAKDRPALYMVEAAEESGDLERGDGIVEPTSGNTGIGLAMVGAVKGYDVTLVMPEGKSIERRRLMRAYGAEVELVDGDISAAKARADELEAEAGMVQLRQFENPANPRSHYETTGPEVLEQVGDRTVDALVAGVGTGGTLSGIGRRLRETFPDVRIDAVEPSDNAVLSGGEPGVDRFQGMGPGFIAPNLDVDLIDEVHTVDIEDAEAECRRLAREEGLLVGQSSGASNLAAKDVAAELRESGAYVGDEPLVITVYWDSGERYLSAFSFDEYAAVCSLAPPPRPERFVPSVTDFRRSHARRSPRRRPRRVGRRIASASVRRPVAPRPRGRRRRVDRPLRDRLGAALGRPPGGRRRRLRPRLPPRAARDRRGPPRRAVARRARGRRLRPI
jgi:cysteine synthase A